MPTSEDFVEVEEAPEPEFGELSMIQAIGARQVAAAKKVAELEAQLADAQKELKAISENELPTAMLSVGLTEFALSTGHKFAVVTSHHAGLTNALKDAAFAWLKEHGLDDIIKHDVLITFGRGEEELAAKAVQALKALAPQNKLVDKANIHASTLGAFVRERIMNGDPLPFDLFGVYTRTVAELTEPNEKEAKLAKAAQQANF